MHSTDKVKCSGKGWRGTGHKMRQDNEVTQSSKLPFALFSKQDLKNRHFGNWRFTVYNCVTEVKWWNQSQSTQSEKDQPLFVFSAKLSPAFIASVLQSLYLSMWQWSQKPPSSFETMQQNHNKHPLMILRSKTEKLSELKLPDHTVKIKRCFISYFRNNTDMSETSALFV